MFQKRNGYPALGLETFIGKSVQNPDQRADFTGRAI